MRKLTNALALAGVALTLASCAKPAADETANASAENTVTATENAAMDNVR